jgi:hypothetical protein
MLEDATGDEGQFLASRMGRLPELYPVFAELALAVSLGRRSGEIFGPGFGAYYEDLESPIIKLRPFSSLP